MGDADKSAEYRKQATACLEVAERMSLLDDRVAMLGMAQRWLELAQKADEARSLTAIAKAVSAPGEAEASRPASPAV